MFKDEFWNVFDKPNDQWNLVHIGMARKQGGGEETNNNSYQNEFVTSVMDALGLEIKQTYNLLPTTRLWGWNGENVVNYHLVEVAVESDTEMEQLVVDILWCRGADGVAGDVDSDMGATRAEYAYSAFDVGVGGVFLS